jgi:hypothetical protein
MSLAAASAPFVMPALAAYACPACYGLEEVTPSLYVEVAMAAKDRAKLQETVATAETKVAGFYGSYNGRPTLLACASADCDRKLGGRGARAVAYVTLAGTFIRIAPAGLNETILAHEFSHVELNRRVGRAKTVPAWFDEGVAVIVSDDERYLKSGGEGAQRCAAQPDGQLPESPFEWAPAAGKTPGLYAQAACAVLHWMDANGGRPGLLTALAGVADGKRNLP